MIDQPTHEVHPTMLQNKPRDAHAKLWQKAQDTLKG